MVHDFRPIFLLRHEKSNRNIRESFLFLRFSDHELKLYLFKSYKVFFSYFSNIYKTK